MSLNSASSLLPDGPASPCDVRPRRRWHDTEAVNRLIPRFPEGLRQRTRFLRAAIGACLIAERRPQVNLYRVVRGMVSFRSVASDGTLVTQSVTDGDWLVGSDLWDQPVKGWASCERPSILLAVPLNAFRDSLKINPVFARVWCDEMLEQLGRLRRRRMRLQLVCAEQRVTHFLKTESPSGCGEVELPYLKLVWAAHLGVAPETLSRLLKKMEAEGKLEIRPGNRLRLLSA